VGPKTSASSASLDAASRESPNVYELAPTAALHGNRASDVQSPLRHADDDNRRTHHHVHPLGIADRLTLRAATHEDLAAIVAIYNAGIAQRIATFETDPRTESDIAGWLTNGQPLVVAVRDGRVQGFARAGRYSDRRVYSGVGEHAVYVHPDARGLGIGRRLLIELCAHSERHGLYKLTSRVFTDNLASRAAHRAAGFEEVGIQRRHGRLDGRWKDCVLVEWLLGEATDRG
jgi:L-amino acid N-acyltransferase YncA